jgi:hypothetical protein
MHTANFATISEMLDNPLLPSRQFVSPFAFALRGVDYDESLSIDPPSRSLLGDSLTIQQAYSLYSHKMADYLTQNISDYAATSFWPSVKAESGIDTRDPATGSCITRNTGSRITRNT